MPEELVLPLLLLVFHGVEEGAVVGGPDDGADALDELRQNLPGAKILDVEGVLAEAAIVAGVCQQLAVVGDGHGAEGHEALAFGQGVHIQHDLFLALGLLLCAAFAAEDRVLTAFFGARVVPEAAVGEGNGDVGFFDVAEHLVIELFLQFFCAGKDSRGVGIFRFEILEDFRAFLFAEPGVVVGQRVAVEGRFRVSGGGNRRLKGGSLLRHGGFSLKGIRRRAPYNGPGTRSLEG